MPKFPSRRQVQSFLLLCLILAAIPLSLANPPAWKLIWSDEFNHPGPPDPHNWTPEIGFVRNEEAQWYQPANASCRDGLLMLEARREQHRNPHYVAGSHDWQTAREFAQYTSASITTQGLHSWQYGRFEMRGRIDTRAGMWPAFWTLGTAGEWPSNGEVDVMEYYRNMLLANLAWGSATRYKAIWSSVRKPLANLPDPEWSSHFHVWRMDWEADSINLYVDDILMNSVDLNRTTNSDGSGKNPFRQPHYLLLDLAIGGQNGGDPATTTFPGKFEVDYVRVYQRAM